MTGPKKQTSHHFSTSLANLIVAKLETTSWQKRSQSPKKIQRHGVPKFCCDVLTFQLIRFFFNLLTPAEEDLGSPKLGSKLMFLMDRANFSFSLLKFFFPFLEPETPDIDVLIGLAFSLKSCFKSPKLVLSVEVA